MKERLGSDQWDGFIQKKNERDGGCKGSGVYDVRGNSAVGACLDDPRRGVNKCVHKGKLMQDWERWNEGGKRPGLFARSWRCRIVRKPPDTV